MRFFLPLILCIACSGPALARCSGESLLETLSEAERATLAAEAARVPYGEGLIWRAQKGDRRITLVGTMHIYDRRLESLMERVTPLVVRADRVLLEMTPEEEVEARRAFTEEPERLVLQEHTLPELLDEETWQRIAEAARQRSVPAVVAAKFRPWYLAMTLATPACALADMSEGRGGLDHMIMDVAEREGLPMQALEEWDSLFAAFDADPLSDQLQLLRLSLIPEEVQEAGFVALLDGYFAGRTGELRALSRLGTGAAPGLSEAEARRLAAESEEMLIDARNRAWLPEIEAAAGRRLLVAVGAAHLPGEAGLLKLLDDAGWRVSRVSG